LELKSGNFLSKYALNIILRRHTTAPLAAAVVALASHAARSGDGPGAAALRRALHAWHPDIQAGAAIFYHNDDGVVHGGVEALAAGAYICPLLSSH